MTSAHPKKLRFVPAPGEEPIVPEYLIPDEARDEYGVDAAVLVKHLAALIHKMAAYMEAESFYFVAGDFIAKAAADVEKEKKE